MVLAEAPWLLSGDELEHFQQGGDLADHLILARATRAGELPMLSVDQRFSTCQGVQFLPAAPPMAIPQEGHP